jgi:hypothetical protein
LREDAPGNVIKVIAAVDEEDPWGRETEGLWAEPLGADRFKLCNVPLHARGLNWGDVVRCERRELEGGDEYLEIAAVVERSGHVGFSVYAETPDDQRDEVLRDLEAMGAWFEWYEPGAKGGGRLYAVDVPPEADWRPVYDYLAKAEEEACSGDRAVGAAIIRMARGRSRPDS